MQRYQEATKVEVHKVSKGTDPSHKGVVGFVHLYYYPNNQASPGLMVELHKCCGTEALTVVVRASDVKPVD